MLQQYLSIAINGLALGTVLFLAAIGLTILFGILRILNFAHGSFIMLGAYLTSTMLRAIGPQYGPVEFILITLGAAVLIGVAGLVLDLLVFRRLHGKDEAIALIATFAVMLAINGTAKLIWGANYISVDAPAAWAGALQLGPVTLPMYSAVLFVIGVLVFVLLEVFLHYSWTGKTLRAIAEDRWIMGILGHSPRRLELLAVFLSFALAGFAGGVLVPNQILQPHLGDLFIIQAFAVVIVGGLGSVRGTFVAALVLGLAETVGALIMPSLSLYVCMILILVLRPQGLFPSRLAVPPGRWSFEWLFGALRRRPGPAAGFAGNTAASAALQSNVLPAGQREALQRQARPPRHGLALLALAVVLGTLPLWSGSGIVHLASLVLLGAVFAMSWNLLFGFAGIATFGHAAFFAIGAYLAGYLLKAHATLPFELILLAAFALGGVLAAVLGLIAIRRANGVQLAILTLALAEVARVLISYAPGLGRDEGLSAIPRPTIGWDSFALHLASPTAYYLFVLVIAALLITLLWMASYSDFGRTLQCIRQDPQRALFLGINVDGFRWVAFVFAAAVAATVGALAAPLSQIVTPDAASIARSTEPMLRTLVGGAGTFWGPAVGTFVFAAIEYSARTLAGLSEFIMGITLLVIVLIAPGGVVAFVRALQQRLARLRRAPAATPTPASTTITAKELS